jgi:hypothetical protein
MQAPETQYHVTFVPLPVRTDVYVFKNDRVLACDGVQFDIEIAARLNGVTFTAARHSHPTKTQQNVHLQEVLGITNGLLPFHYIFGI